MLETEKFSVWSHVLGVCISILGLIILIITNLGNSTALILSLIYGFSLIFLFSASSLYHTHKKEEKEQSMWRKIDHIAIFCLIAGTYTPFAYVFLEGYLQWLIIGAQWIIVVIGGVFKLFFMNLPKWADVLIYVLMGWMIILPINQLLNIVPLNIFLLILFGGIFYTIGALIYASKITLISSKINTHDIFHVFILIAAFLHYLGVFKSLTFMT